MEKHHLNSKMSNKTVNMMESFVYSKLQERNITEKAKTWAYKLLVKFKKNQMLPSHFHNVAYDKMK